MSEWVFLALAAIVVIVYNIDSITIKFRGKGSGNADETQQIKYTSPRKQLKK